ncbi:MAG: deoxyguanosinetriphosphate triphosphohydrolase [Gammaproteobacteria bacterium]|nr:MAG: deoxyguanosinetriphosphate triphosphohydrolase [Gammaproteobacteria bacterium]
MTGPSATVALFAVDESTARGRRISEPPPTHRSEFQRDRDRVIHSSAFRRLVYKTQVFVNHEGDLYRTRLTHSLEVAQIARTVAGALSLNEYLVEAICLAHDLGHTPFGHAGQDALNACMRDHGGFEHNLQSLRVVDELEEKYADFAGLNLMYETREGILKHCSSRHARGLGELGRRFLEGRQPALEAQLANLADEVAYNSHDVDDGLRAGLLGVDELREVTIFSRAYDEVRRRYPELQGRRLIYEIVRRLIGYMVDDLVEESSRRLLEAAPVSVEEVRSADRPLMGFSRSMADQHRQLKRFLMHHLYRHPRVVKMSNRAWGTLTELFEAYQSDIRLMPSEFSLAAENAAQKRGESARLRVVADYIAGMTDRYAILEHDRLFPADGAD